MTGTDVQSQPKGKDIEQEVAKLLRAAGRCPRPGEPVPQEYLAALLALRDLTGWEWLEPSRKNCNSGPAEEWFELLVGGDKPVSVVWGRKDGRHVAGAFLLAALVNLLPSLADEVQRLRKQVADYEEAHNIPSPSELWGAGSRATP